MLDIKQNVYQPITKAILIDTTTSVYTSGRATAIFYFASSASEA
jgi:hypothetical protein